MSIINRTVAWLTWRQLFANRRLYLALAFALTPVIVTLLFRWLVPEKGIEGAAGFFLVIQKEVIVGTLLPIAAVVFGTSAFGGEMDDGTLVYLLVKPVPRWTVVLSKYVVAVSATTLVMLVAIFGSWYALGVAELPFAAPKAYFYGTLVGAVLYSALFVMLGIATKRSLIVGLFYVIAFEAVLSRSAPGTRALSIREFANTVTLKTADPWLNLGAPTLSTTNIVYGGAFFLIGGLAFAVWRLHRYQMAERL